MSELYMESCCNCGIEFAIPADWRQQRLKDHRQFFCPNGHSQSYVKGPVEELKGKLIAAEKAATQERDKRLFAERALDNANRKLVRTTKKLTRIEKRIAQGICPCCEQRFPNLGQHIAEMHPEFSSENPDIMRGLKGLLPQTSSLPKEPS